MKRGALDLLHNVTEHKIQLTAQLYMSIRLLPSARPLLLLNAETLLFQNYLKVFLMGFISNRSPQSRSCGYWTWYSLKFGSFSTTFHLFITATFTFLIFSCINCSVMSWGLNICGCETSVNIVKDSLVRTGQMSEHGSPHSSVWLYCRQAWPTDRQS